MQNSIVELLSTVLDRLANGDNFNTVIEDTGITAVVNAAKASAATGEARWEDACNRQGWNESTQIIHLEGFIRSTGLFGAFADYAEAAADEEECEADALDLRWETAYDDATSGQQHNRCPLTVPA